MRRRKAYRRSFKTLTPALQKAVEAAEAEIAEDPTHNHWRRPGSNGTTIDLTASDRGVLVSFREVSATVTELVELLDLHGVRIG